MGNIGIMGGTFDPIHNGHLMLGEQAWKEYQLDEVWFMPSGHPPHKNDRKVTDPGVRLAMTELAVRGKTGFICSDFEVRRNGSTYTSQTLKLLREAYPQHQFFFIIGADSLYEIEKWYEPDQVLSQAVFLAARREYEDAHPSMEKQIAILHNKYNADIRILHCEEMDISSEMLRERIAKGLSVSDYVPPEVFEFINNQGLYQKKDKSMIDDITELRNDLKEKLSPLRYEHTLSVSFICTALAMCYSFNLDQAELAGLLHDCAKHYGNEEIIKKCRKQDILLTDDELKAPVVLHAKYGAWLAEHKYNITDQEVINAIRWHTTGRPDMSLLEKIVFTADFIEPRRERAPDLLHIRSLAFTDLDECVYQILKNTLEYLESKGKFVDSVSNQAYAYYKQVHNEKKGETR